jgi:hypothetical protein
MVFKMLNHQFSAEKLQSALIYIYTGSKIDGNPQQNLSRHYLVRISAKDADWLRQRVEEVGGLQLHATREPT